MRHLPSRARIPILILLVALALLLGTMAIRPRLERAIRSRIEAEAARRGWIARMSTVRIGGWPPLTLGDVALERGPDWRLTARSVEARWWGGVRLSVREALLKGPAGLTVAADFTRWVLDAPGHDPFRAALAGPRPGLILGRTSDRRGSRWKVEARDFEVGRVFDIRRFGRPVVDSGTVSGLLLLRASEAAHEFNLDLRARSARLPGLAESGASAASLGRPTEVILKIGGVWNPREGTLEIPRWHAEVQGAAISGALRLSELESDPLLNLSLNVERMDFGVLLRTWGLEPPKALAGSGTGRPDELGSATLAATARGRLSDPASFVVTQKLDFRPPGRVPPAIERLRGDFLQEVVPESGPRRSLVISPASPDFIPLAEVPPLFQRALLIAEDAGFYGHPGVDLREVPAALITDWSRGRPARGASTITQQLAKNLFLSPEKHLGRKLQEVAVTLLLESALEKRRILEIYLNVIEWGPDLYGLRPAARSYFGREPSELSPAQMAFLISIIPGPRKYQSSFARGTPGPGLRKIIDNLLAKLRSVDALTEEEYQQALAEEIAVQGRDAPPSP